jgi:hypothetical protein
MEKYQEELRGTFLVKLDLRRVTTFRLNFGMTGGVGIRPLRKLFWNCLVFLVLRMLMWLIIWSVLVEC